MITVQIQLIDTGAQRAVQALAATLAPGPRRRAFNGALGRTAANELKDHFAAADASKVNGKGFKRAHFWSRIRRATAYDPARTTDDGAVVVIADPAIKAHVFGGTWGAKTSKYLAIPVHPRAYGVGPKSGSIAGLKFMPSKRSGNVVGWLYADEAGRPANKRGKGGSAAGRVFYYRLQKTVTVGRDPTALPTPEKMGAAVLREARAHIARQIQGGNTAT